jgi:hypothetical protein
MASAGVSKNMLLLARALCKKDRTIERFCFLRSAFSLPAIKNKSFGNFHAFDDHDEIQFYDWLCSKPPAPTPHRNIRANMISKTSTI